MIDATVFSQASWLHLLPVPGRVIGFRFFRAPPGCYYYLTF